MDLEWKQTSCYNCGVCCGLEVHIKDNEKRITAKSELQCMVKRAAECESKLTAMLNDEEKHTLSVLMSA